MSLKEYLLNIRNRLSKNQNVELQELNDKGLTLLSEEEIWGDGCRLEVLNISGKEVFRVNHGRQLEVLSILGVAADITDLCILTGCAFFESTDITIPEDELLKRRDGEYWTKSDDDFDYHVRTVNGLGDMSSSFCDSRHCAIRPVLKSPVIFSQVYPNRVIGYKETEEVEYGEYPQYAADSIMQSILELEYERSILESEYKGELNKTERSYTFDSVKWNDYDTGFKPVSYEEYEYQGKKYVRIRANSFDNAFTLSNRVKYRYGDYVWVEVSPVKWLIDDRTGTLVSKRGLVSGIRFSSKETCYNGDFSRKEMKEYLDKYMLHDLTQTAILTSIQEMTPSYGAKKEEQPKVMSGFRIREENMGDIIRKLEDTTESLFAEGTHAIDLHLVYGPNNTDNELRPLNLPYHLYDDKWLTAMIGNQLGNNSIPKDVILDFVKFSPFLKCCRKDYEVRIAEYQTCKALYERDCKSFIRTQYGEYDHDLGVKQFVTDSLTAIGISSDSIKQGFKEGIENCAPQNEKKLIKRRNSWPSLDELNRNL